MVFEHVDLRVAQLAAAQPFYDAFLKAFGFRGRRQNNGDMLSSIALDAGARSFEAPTDARKSPTDTMPRSSTIHRLEIVSR